VPRLRQRIVRVPPGCGRPVWVDDPTFAVDRHLDVEACPPPGDEPAMLAAAAELLVRPLPVDRPLWAARFITGLAGGQVALVVVVQHALADGLGGLAVLGALLDGAPPPVDRPFPIPAPTRPELATDAFATWARIPVRLPGLLRRPPRSPRPPKPARPARIGRAAACSLLSPTGPRRRVAVARADLEAIRATAHVRSATVNDALVSAIAGAMHACLEHRGEDPPQFVIAVPVAVRRGTTAADPGNAFTEARAAVSGGGDPGQRLADVAAVMRQRKESTMAPVTLSVAAVAVRIMVASGAYGWYMRRQRYLHTVTTNLRGPDQPVALNGAPITGMLPLAVGGGGNVTVTFAALSYAGTLAVTVTADPDVTSDLPLLTAELQTQLDLLHG
jgi:diacylglycerol O-acyltransferase / wax synthase